MKKFAGCIIILHMCTKYHNHVMYGSWDRVRQTKKFFILGNFLSFYLPPLMIPKIKILKKMNKMPGVIVLLYIHVYHMIYGSWNITSNREIFNILGYFFALSALDNLENQNFNIEKNTWRYYNFTHLHHKWQSHDV